MHIYNTLTRRKEPFKPLVDGKVSMYVCGMTVYDLCHIGHARSMVAFDVVQRWLRMSGYQVTYVRNITDIDDKIIDRANREGRPWEEITHKCEDVWFTAMRELNVLRPTDVPHATEYVAQMVDMIGTLMAKTSSPMSCRSKKSLTP